eukprot:Partr_v1_DN27261_c0_g1_i2_m38611 putative Vacuolar effluxer which mediate the efflux of amino acids resulting from autophagic degradation. The release of autophagic amino acids allows the maintenance of protein synthesis and viability during nitrogen starvation (By similarity)
MSTINITSHSESISAECKEPPITDRREMLGWIAYDFASSVFPSVANQVFIPLILEKMAFNGGTIPDSGLPCSSYPTLPTSSGGELRPCQISLAGTNIQTVSFALYVSSCSVVLQALIFLSFGALADYGKWRQILHIICSTIGALLAMSFVLILGDDQYLAVAILVCVTNTAYGLTIVLYNSYLPVLVQNHPVMRGGLEDMNDLSTIEKRIELFGASQWWNVQKSKLSQLLVPFLDFLETLRCRSSTRYEEELQRDLEIEADATISVSSTVSTYSEPSIVFPAVSEFFMESVKQEHGISKLRFHQKLMTSLQDRLANTLSTHGLASGQLSTLIVIGISAGIVAKIQGVYGMQIAVAVCGVWWFAFSFITWTQMKSRPGPPLPSDAGNYIIFSWKKIIRALGHYKKLPNTYSYLVAYFIFSDSFTTIGQIAILFASKTIGMTAAQISVALVMAPIFALAGGYWWLWISRRYRWTTKKTLLILLGFTTLLPIYGLLGYTNIKSQYVFAEADEATGSGKITLGFGLTSVVEMYVAVGLFAILLGAVQSFGRVLYADLLPPGRESEFFALYEITDRGTSWIGPLVVGAISQATGGELRMGFGYVLATLLCGIVLIARFVNVEHGRQDCDDFAREEAEQELKLQQLIGHKPVDNDTKGSQSMPSPKINPITEMTELKGIKSTI